MSDHHAHLPDPPLSVSPAPLRPILAVSFLNSVGTGIVTSGIYFLTEQGYDFSRTQNYILGLLLGLTYVASAFWSQRLTELARSAFFRLSTRGVLVGIMAAMAALCTLPWAARTAFADRPAIGIASIWVLVALYSPLTGILWPIIESFVSGGRHGEDLRRTMGLWNIVWSSALVTAYWTIAPVIKHHAAETILVLGGVHALAIPIVRLLPREPGQHLDDHEPHPPVYRALLVTFRMLLPVSYVVGSALGPYLPSALRGLGVPDQWHTILGSAWQLPRCITFAVLAGWHGWYGRWNTAIVGGGLVLLGFAGCVLAPTLTALGLSTTACVVVLVGGLTVFGIGMATIYTAAIYYAMSVGQSEVQAGGKHEALIGAGYTIGPACGLAASGAVTAGLLPEPGFNATVLGVVGALAVSVGVVVVVRVARVSRDH